MIRGFTPPQEEVPAEIGFQPVPALEAGLIAGVVLLLVPHGSPWSSLTFFSPVVMGRVIPPSSAIPLPVAWAIHLGISLLFGVFVASTVVRFQRYKAVLIGGLAGAVLFVAGFGVVSVLFPELRGGEFSVFFTHVVFGLIAAGAYRGLLRRKAVMASHA